MIYISSADDIESNNTQGNNVFTFTIKGIL